MDGQTKIVTFWAPVGAKKIDQVDSKNKDMG